MACLLRIRIVGYWHAKHRGISDRNSPYIKVFGDSSETTDLPGSNASPTSGTRNSVWPAWLTTGKQVREHYRGRSAAASKDQHQIDFAKRQPLHCNSRKRMSTAGR